MRRRSLYEGGKNRRRLQGVAYVGERRRERRVAVEKE